MYDFGPPNLFILNKMTLSTVENLLSPVETISSPVGVLLSPVEELLFPVETVLSPVDPISFTQPHCSDIPAGLRIFPVVAIPPVI
jgi:hypothetical protein